MARSISCVCCASGTEAMTPASSAGESRRSPSPSPRRRRREARPPRPASRRSSADSKRRTNCSFASARSSAVQTTFSFSAAASKRRSKAWSRASRPCHGSGSLLTCIPAPLSARPRTLWGRPSRLIAGLTPRAPPWRRASDAVDDAAGRAGGGRGAGRGRRHTLRGRGGAHRRSDRAPRAADRRSSSRQRNRRRSGADRCRVPGAAGLLSPRHGRHTRDGRSRW